MATLAELRKKVQTRLRDWGGDLWDEFELNILLNEAQDQFTRDTQYLRATDIIPVLQGEGLYTISAPTNHRVGNVMAVVYFDGVRDDVPLLPVTLAQMQLLDPDWRHRVTGRPQYLIRNYNPYQEGVAANNSVYMYPVLEDPLTTSSMTETRTIGAAASSLYFVDAPAATLTSVTNASDGTVYVAVTNYTYTPGNNYITNVNIPSGTAIVLTYTVSPCLRVTYALVTDGQMTTDSTEMALPEATAEEALINYAVAEALSRRQLENPDKASLLKDQATFYREKYTDRMIRASVESKVGFTKGFTNAKGYYV